MRRLFVPILIVLAIVSVSVCGFAKEVDLFTLLTGDW